MIDEGAGGGGREQGSQISRMPYDSWLNSLHACLNLLSVSSQTIVSCVSDQDLSIYITVIFIAIKHL